MLVHAINVYLNDNYPESPQNFNFQAELKAASHWHWLDDGEWCLELGPHDDRRVKFAAKQTFDKWVKELNKEREQPSKKSKEDCCSSEEDERVSGKQARICSSPTVRALSAVCFSNTHFSRSFALRILLF